MSSWRKITTSSDRRYVKNTIGKVVSSDDDYYYLEHWEFPKRKIQVLKRHTEAFSTDIGKLCTYWKYPINFKISKYVDDHKTGDGSYSTFTGLRVELVPANPIEAEDLNIKERFEVYLDEITLL